MAKKSAFAPTWVKKRAFCTLDHRKSSQLRPLPIFVSKLAVIFKNPCSWEQGFFYSSLYKKEPWEAKVLFLVYYTIRPVDYSAELFHVGVAEFNKFIRCNLAAPATSAIDKNKGIFIGNLLLCPFCNFIFRD